jgi:diacylglycerol kinase (ATP)
MSKPQSPGNKPNGKGLGRVLKATYCSYKGFKAAWVHESAFRQELLLVIILLPLSFLLSQSRAQLVMLIVSLLFLLFAEIINSAIEALADSVSLEHNVLIGRAKDMGSSGVFLAISILVLVWGEALYSRFLTIAIS